NEYLHASLDEVVGSRVTTRVPPGGGSGTFRSTYRNVRLWLAVAVLVLVLAGGAAVARAYFDLQGQAAAAGVPPPGAAFPIPDLATLTRQADLVVLGRVASAGTTRLLTQPAQTPIPFAGPTRAIPPEASRTTSLSIPSTRFPIQVERVLKGAPPNQQQQI